MKKAVNIRLDESIIFILDNLSKELNTTKTEIIEKAIKMFSKKHKSKKNNLLKFAGALKEKDTNELLDSLKDKNIKDISLSL